MHWGKTDAVGSEHLIDGQSFAAEVFFLNKIIKYIKI